MLAGQGECEGKAKEEDVKETTAEELVGFSAPKAPTELHGGEVVWLKLRNEAWKEE